MAKLYINSTLNREYTYTHDGLFYEIKKYEKSKLSKEMKLTNLLTYINYKLDRLPITEIVFYSEPFMRRDIMELLKILLNTTKVHITLVTSGSGLLQVIDDLEQLDTTRLELILDIYPVELVEGDYAFPDSVLKKLQSSILNYKIKLPVTKVTSVYEIIQLCQCVKGQKFVMELPLITEEFNKLTVSDTTFSYTDMEQVIKMLLTIAGEFQNDEFYIAGIPKCWINDVGLMSFISDNTFTYNPLHPTKNSATIQPARVIDFNQVLHSRIVGFNECNECINQPNCTGVYNYLITKDYKPNILKGGFANVCD